MNNMIMRRVNYHSTASWLRGNIVGMNNILFMMISSS